MKDRSNISSLELAVMGLLWQQPRSGYDLLKIFTDTAIGSFGSSPGAIYPALKRMEADGKVHGEVQKGDTLRPRQVFRLTDCGEEALKHHLRQPVTRDDIVRHADGFPLRFAFTGEVLGREEAVRLLGEFARHIESYLPDLQAQLKQFPEGAGASPYGRYALQHGIDMYRAEVRWAKKVIKELADSA